MWLLRLHFAISVLCLITFLGFRAVYKQQIKDNGWGGDNKKKKSIGALFIFFVPIMNIISAILILVMASMKKSDFDKAVEESKKKDSESE